ncbi:MAG: hypothetical protein P1U37_15170 [Minwuia sp.]|nr:hypothetical protein [Minwuia sp.]
MLWSLKAIEILLTFVAGFIAVGGETYRKAEGNWYRRITGRGWLAIGCLSLMLVSNGLSLRAGVAAQDAKNRALRVFRENVCWVVVADGGARAGYDHARSNASPYLIGGKSGFEAVKQAQGHNSSVVEQIDAVGVIETESVIERLQELLDNGSIQPFVTGSCPGIIAEYFG